MKSSDRTILLGLAVVGLLAAFWFFLLAPKRGEVSELDKKIETAQASLTEQQQIVATAELAKANYKRAYHHLIVLGKAVPGDDDTASLLEQTQTLADRADVEFRGILAATAPTDPAAATAPPPAAAPADPSAAPTAAATPAAVPATEATAATLPIGAGIGPAGLPVMPYDLSLRGHFFDFADFLAEVDKMVRTRPRGVGVDGRLLTIDGFSLAGDAVRGFPYLDADLRVSSYVTPADQGVTAGATETAPATTTVGAPAPTTTPAPPAAAVTGPSQ